MWIHFDDLPIGARFVRAFITPVWTKTSDMTAEISIETRSRDQLMRAFGGYCFVFTRELVII